MNRVKTHNNVNADVGCQQRFRLVPRLAPTDPSGLADQSGGGGVGVTSAGEAWKVVALSFDVPPDSPRRPR